MTVVKDAWKSIYMANTAIHIQFTSLDMSGQGYKLAEPCHLKGVAQDVGLSSTDIEVTDNQSVLFRVDVMLKYVGCSGERFVLRPVDVYDVNLVEAGPGQLNVFRSKVVVAQYL